MNKYILFLSYYPDANTIRDGMAQRILAVDRQFVTEERIYLSLSFRKHRHPTFFRQENVTFKCLNVFLHFFDIVKFFRQASCVYLHSLFNAIPAFIFFLLTGRNKRVIWDVHGVVPEELMVLGKKNLSRICSLMESYMFKRAHSVVVVSKAMQLHLEEKYGISNSFCIYPIIPQNVLKASQQFCNLPDSTEKVVVYSGNMQPWQNIELMLKVIAKNIDNGFQYYILTGEPEHFRAALEGHKLLEHPNISLLSVQPDELSRYYSLATYGFILRDDIPVNSSACPTKLLEYLAYGIIPIIKSEKMGDFLSMGYEYLHYKDFDFVYGQHKKSRKNIAIANAIVESGKKVDLSKLCSC